MRQSLSDFVLGWNKLYGNFTFSYDETPVTKRPTRVEIRFSSYDYDFPCSYNAFTRLHSLVQDKSHDTMYITTDKNLLKKGIMEIKIASDNPEYREEYVVGALKGIGNELLSHKVQANAG